MSKIQGGTI